jgi:hypothetical protein
MMPPAIMAMPTRLATGASLPRPVNANPVEPLPVFPVDEGLLTTAATADVVVVVAPTLEVGINVVEVVDVLEVVVDVVGEVGVEVDVVDKVGLVGEVVVVVVVVVGVVTVLRVTTLKPSAS